MYCGTSTCVAHNEIAICLDPTDPSHVHYSYWIGTDGDVEHLYLYKPGNGSAWASNIIHMASTGFKIPVCNSLSMEMWLQLPMWVETLQLHIHWNFLTWDLFKDQTMLLYIMEMNIWVLATFLLMQPTWLQAIQTEDKEVQEWCHHQLTYILK